jgi:hypothetical protein
MLSYPASFTFISDEVSQDPAAVVAFALKHGFGGFELRSMCGRHFVSCAPEGSRKSSTVRPMPVPLHSA